MLSPVLSAPTLPRPIAHSAIFLTEKSLSICFTLFLHDEKKIFSYLAFAKTTLDLCIQMGFHLLLSLLCHLLLFFFSASNNHLLLFFFFAGDWS